MHRLVRVPLVLSSVVVLLAAQACARSAPAALPVLEGGQAQSPGAPPVLAPDERSAADSTKHVVVLFMQNNSFNKLFGLWDEVNGDPVDNIARADSSATIQIGQDGKPLSCLLTNDLNLQPGAITGAPACTATAGGESYRSTFSNAPFLLNDVLPAGAVTCPPPGTDASLAKFAQLPADNGVPANSPGAQAGGCTRDLVHRFYQEQYQLNDGAMDRFAVGSDAAGLVMGHYDTRELGTTKGAHDEFGPGTRVPTLIVSNGLPRSGVDSTTYDLASVIGTITAKFGLKPINRRDSEQATIWAAWSALGK